MCVNQMFLKKIRFFVHASIVMLHFALTEKRKLSIFIQFISNLFGLPEQTFVNVFNLQYTILNLVTVEQKCCGQ